MQVITVTLQTNCDIYNGTNVTISGLTGSQTPDADASTVESALALNLTGTVFQGGESTWTQATGSLTLTVFLGDFHWLKNTPMTFSFTLKTNLNGQVNMHFPWQIFLLPEKRQTSSREILFMYMPEGGLRKETHVF